MRRTLLAHARSLIAESTVACMAAMAVFAAVFAAGTALDLDRAASTFLGLAFAIPMPAFMLALKTLFPYEIPHRSLGISVYVVVGQITAAIMAAAMLELVGECFDCRGNLHDIALYGLGIGTVSGIFYAAFSKMFSLDVDTPGRDR